MFSENHIYYNALNIDLSSNFRKIKELLQFYGSFRKAHESLKSDLDVERLIKELGKNNVRLVLQSDNEFPERLRQIPDAPFGLYVLGSLPSNICMSVVGTRKPTMYGEKLSFEIAERLTKFNIDIISGLAYGIDTSAHRGALKHGKTFAVLASGLSYIYPRENISLVKEILEKGGGLISEYPYFEKPKQYRFLERNRITSGFSDNVIIIEAPQRSGSISTARHALEQGSDIYVAPGEVYNSNFTGSHELIRDGAKIITSVDDFLKEVNLT